MFQFGFGADIYRLCDVSGHFGAVAWGESPSLYIMLLLSSCCPGVPAASLASPVGMIRQYAGLFVKFMAIATTIGWQSVNQLWHSSSSHPNVCFSSQHVLCLWEDEPGDQQSKPMP